jgi:hypothetical protein
MRRSKPGKESPLRAIQEDAGLVAYYGLYCGACKTYLKEKCDGCHRNEKASWCTVRSCCAGKGLASCAECTDFSETKDCRKFNNFISRMFGLLFRSDRAACINQIKDLGLVGHAKRMAELKMQSLKR